MVCPYCDSVIRDLPDNHICPHCGASLALYSKIECKGQQKSQLQSTSRRVRGITFPNPPVGRYKDAAGYLEVGEDGITFYRKQFIRESKRTIRFGDIYAVSYKPGVTLNSGFLCVREWKDRNIPLVHASSDAVFDETSVYFVKSKNGIFEQIYMFLKQCEELVHSAEI